MEQAAVDEAIIATQAVAANPPVTVQNQPMTATYIAPQTTQYHRSTVHPLPQAQVQILQQQQQQQPTIVVVNQPASLTGVRPQNITDWSSGICDCCNDCGICNIFTISYVHFWRIFLLSNDSQQQ